MSAASSILHALEDADVAISEQIVDLRWGPLTSLMLLLSAWWVKDLVFAFVALAHDLRRRRPPWAALVVGLATALGSWVADLLKPVFDRARPFEQDLWSGLGSLPSSASMPSGHALSAVAAAVALGRFVPAARVPAYGLAALVCLSRVYLGVHFAGDVVVGALLGALVAGAVVFAARRLLGDRPATAFRRPRRGQA